MTPITTKEISDAVKQADIKFWPIRKCRLCGTEIGYRFLSKRTAHFDPNCKCSANILTPRMAPFQEIVDLINIQKGDKLKQYRKFWDNPSNPKED